MTCKSRVCSNEFSKEANRQEYCSQKCKNKEAYQLYKDKGGNRWRDTKIIYTLECNSRDCNKEFDTTNRMKKYCSTKCSKKEIQKRNTEKGSEGSYKPRTKKKLVCGYRNCKIEFESSHAKAKYCCSKHAKQEAYIVNADKNRPNRVIQIRHPEEREKRFAIPKCSTKWLQEAFENRVVA